MQTVSAPFSFSHDIAISRISVGRCKKNGFVGNSDTGQPQSPYPQQRQCASKKLHELSEQLGELCGAGVAGVAGTAGIGIGAFGQEGQILFLERIKLFGDADIL